MPTLEDHVRHHIKSYYAEHCGASLGYCDMPDGYALLKGSSGWFYWVRHDGDESVPFSCPANVRIDALADKVNDK